MSIYFVNNIFYYVPTGWEEFMMTELITDHLVVGCLSAINYIRCFCAVSVLFTDVCLAKYCLV